MKFQSTEFVILQINAILYFDFCFLSSQIEILQAFQLGSSIVEDMSKAVLKVTESEEMGQIQDKWFGKKTSHQSCSTSLNSSLLVSISVIFRAYSSSPPPLRSSLSSSISSSSSATKRAHTLQSSLLFFIFLDSTMLVGWVQSHRPQQRRRSAQPPSPCRVLPTPRSSLPSLSMRLAIRTMKIMHPLR